MRQDNLVYDHILIRYGELSTKGKNRKDFIKKLFTNVKNALSGFPALTLEKTHDRMYINLNGEDPFAVKPYLEKVFGISSFSFAIRCASDIEAIKATTLTLARKEEGRTFKVAARRSWKQFPMISDEINRAVAGNILRNTEWKVDVKTPDVKIQIEVHEQDTYIMTDKYPGAGGYPVGVGGKAMVMLSGGIDSSVIAVLCADVFGPDHVHGVMLPGPYSTEHSLDDARELADNLGIETHVVSICEPFEAFEAVLRRSGCGKLSGTASENTQARCRTVVLMALSNANGWMLVNTGNRSESMMGYSTLYGDTAGAFAPIGGLYKTDVYAIARWRNERAERDGQVPPIPEHVLVKPPSAELAPGQEDEKSLGIDYPTLDRMLIAHFEHGVSENGLVEAGFNRADVERVLAKVRSQAFKRALEPPYPDAKFYE